MAAIFPLAGWRAGRSKKRPFMLEYLIHLLGRVQHSLQDPLWLGILAFAGIFVVAQLVMIPVSPVGMAAGVFFGFGWGLTGLMLGCAIGASVNFLIARYFARERVARWLSGHEKFRLIDEAIGREGWKIIILLRFVPIPFGLANYCYGLTSVRFWPYFAATMVAVIPSDCLFVWMGKEAGDLTSLIGKGRPIHPLEYGLIGVGIVAAILVLKQLATIAHRTVTRGPAPR